MSSLEDSVFNLIFFIFSSKNEKSLRNLEMKESAVKVFRLALHAFHNVVSPSANNPWRGPARTCDPSRPILFSLVAALFLFIFLLWFYFFSNFISCHIFLKIWHSILLLRYALQSPAFYLDPFQPNTFFVCVLLVT